MASVTVKQAVKKYGEVTRSGFRSEAGTVLPLPKGHKAKAGQKAVYGIRPEHFGIGKGSAATVSVVEPTGPEMHVYADMGGQEVCAVTQARVKLARGAGIGLAPALDKAHLFDAETGKAIR